MSSGSFLGNRIPYSVVVWAIVAVILIWLLRRSGWGRLIYAVGDNETAVRLAGVRVWQVKISAYMAAGVLGSIAGMLLAGRTGAVDLQLAAAFLLPSVAAAVIGGTSIFGGVGGYTGHDPGRADPERAQFDVDLFERGAGDSAGGVWVDRAGAGVGVCEFNAAGVRR